MGGSIITTTFSKSLLLCLNSEPFLRISCSSITNVSCSSPSVLSLSKTTSSRRLTEIDLYESASGFEASLLLLLLP